ncbi:MAG: hypothetical protein HUK02_03030 [Bacteroidaceae bacterium]|nr:hypothetical protein [Bacteroidaceae bacterium]
MEKIQELTEKIYREGVEKGKAEAARIVEEANAEAAKIVAAAKEQAEAIAANARKQAGELDQNTKNELKLYTNQALNALKGEVANMLCGKIVSQSVADMVADKDFLGKFTVALASKWVENEPVVIESAEADSLLKYFTANAKQLLDKGVKIEQVNGTSALFTIAPADGSYRVDFGKEEFEGYFKAFLRPQLVEMLF